MEYVMIHELAHLIHMSHSHGFWKEVARACPDFRKKRRELNAYGI
jgi:predicted metal-dependent hydrolase